MRYLVCELDIANRAVLRYLGKDGETTERSEATVFETMQSAGDAALAAPTETRWHLLPDEALP